MTHEEASLTTKRALAAALKTQMERKPLRKITVNDIITTCNLNRKTFYYHFTDIYDLLKWTLEQDAVEVLKKFDLRSDYAAAIRFIMDYVEENAHILNCAYDGMGRDELKRFFINDFCEATGGMVDRCAAAEHCTISASFRSFLIEIYTEALAGILVNWFRETHTPEEKEQTIQYLSLVMTTTLPAVLKKGGKL